MTQSGRNWIPVPNGWTFWIELSRISSESEFEIHTIHIDWEYVMAGYLRGAMYLKGDLNIKSTVSLLVGKDHGLKSGDSLTIYRIGKDGNVAAKWSGTIDENRIKPATPMAGEVTPGMILDVEVNCDIEHSKDEGDVVVVVVTVSNPLKRGDGKESDRDGETISRSVEVAIVQ